VDNGESIAYDEDEVLETMKAFLTTCIVSGALLAGGCATKKYVRNTTAPIQAKVDQVGEQTTQNGQQIQSTQTQVKDVDQRAQNGISAAQEKANSADQHASTADQHASDAMSKANQADSKADRVMTDLRNVVSNLDDYKLQTSATVPFKFNQYKLDQTSKADLDKLATDMQSDKRFFIAVEGYTDKTGTRQYNEALSRKRADAVVEYLVAKHDIPIYRIHMVGLADEKPADEGKGREARAHNRRVEVKVFSADGLASSLDTSDSANRTQDKH
jgi:OmpA-OmpF porin, OOP family